MDSKGAMKRMLSGAVAGILLCLGGTAEAGAVRSTLDFVEATGAVQPLAVIDSKPTCVVVSPGDNLLPGNHNCLKVVLAYHHVNGNVVISPSDNLTKSGQDKCPAVVIGPSDNHTVVISPSDNRTHTCPGNVVISPSDNHTVVISPSDNKHRTFWTVLGQKDGFSAVVNLSEAGRIDLNASSTVQAQAALALLDLGVRADEINLHALSSAVSGLDLNAAQKLQAAAELATERWENGECGSSSSLADRLCSAFY